MNQTQQNTIAECLLRASHLTTLAEFIKTRCSRFGCLCIHEDCRIHVYEEADSHAEFGADGWIRGHALDNEDASRKTFYYSKQVGPVTVSYWRHE